MKQITICAAVMLLATVHLSSVQSTTVASPDLGTDGIQIGIIDLATGRERTCDDTDLNEAEQRICTSVLTHQDVVYEAVVTDLLTGETTKHAQESCKNWEGEEDKTCVSGGDYQSYENNDDGSVDEEGTVWCESSHGEYENTCTRWVRDSTATHLFHMAGDSTSGVIHAGLAEPKASDSRYAWWSYHQGGRISSDGCGGGGGTTHEGNGVTGNIYRDTHCVSQYRGYWGVGMTYTRHHE